MTFLSDKCKTAIFYSITSTQMGLQGIELGTHLIKQVSYNQLLLMVFAVFQISMIRIQALPPHNISVVVIKRGFFWKPVLKHTKYR
jgi:hypothetical protein